MRVHAAPGTLPLSMDGQPCTCPTPAARHLSLPGPPQALLMFGPEYARACGIAALEPLGVFLPGDKNYPGGWVLRVNNGRLFSPSVAEPPWGLPCCCAAVLWLGGAPCPLQSPAALTAPPAPGLNASRPGGWLFDPLNLSADAERYERMRVREIKNGRLAMVAWLGFAAQAAVTRQGPAQNLVDSLLL